MSEFVVVGNTVVANPPDNTSPPVTNSTPIPSAPATPGGSGYAAPITVKDGTEFKIRGSEGNDRVTTKDLARDTDHVIATGAGDDVFIFRQDDATNPALRGAVVNMGAGDNDQVVLANQLSDYQVTFRPGGVVKFEYIGDGTHDNAAIVFQGAELFTFRNIDDQTGATYKAQTFTLATLREAYGIGEF